MCREYRARSCRRCRTAARGIHALFKVTISVNVYFSKCKTVFCQSCTQFPLMVLLDFKALEMQIDCSWTGATWRELMGMNKSLELHQNIHYMKLNRRRVMHVMTKAVSDIYSHCSMIGRDTHIDIMYTYSTDHRYICCRLSIKNGFSCTTESSSSLPSV